MTKVRDLHKKWLKNPEYKAAYDDMAEEFALASAIISATSKAKFTQEELAEKMDAKQSLIAVSYTHLTLPTILLV